MHFSSAMPLYGIVTLVIAFSNLEREKSKHMEERLNSLFKNQSNTHNYI